MISRRSFTALAGATLFGLFARIRFAPSARGPRGRRIGRPKFANEVLIENNSTSWAVLIGRHNGEPIEVFFRSNPEMEWQPLEREATGRAVYRSAGSFDRDVFCEVCAKELGDDGINVVALQLWTIERGLTDRPPLLKWGNGPTPLFADEFDAFLDVQRDIFRLRPRFGSNV